MFIIIIDIIIMFVFAFFFMDTGSPLTPRPFLAATVGELKVSE